MPKIAALLHKPDRRPLLFWLGYLIVILSAVYLRTTKVDSIPPVHEDDVEIASNMRSLRHGREHTWMTVTGRPISPLYAFPALVAQSFLPPTIWVARLPAVVAGALTVLLTFFLLRPLGGSLFAASASALIATHPILFLYSRFGVEPSLLGLAGLFPLVFTWRGEWKKAWLSLLLAIAVHPVGVFLLPVVGLPWIRDQWSSGRLTQARARKRFLGLIAAVLAVGAALLFGLPPWAQDWVTSRFTTNEMLSGFPAFLHTSVRLLSGTPLYIVYNLYLTPTKVFLLILTLSVALLTGLGWGAWHLRRSGQTHLATLFSGLAASYLLFFLVIGPYGFEVKQIRYGMVFTLPTLVLLCAGWFALSERRPLLAGTAALALSVFFLASLDFNFLHAFERPEMGAFPKAKDPLVASLGEIVKIRESRKDHSAQIAVMNDRLVPVFRYLAFDEPNLEFFAWNQFEGVHVSQLQASQSFHFESSAFSELRKAFERGTIFVIAPSKDVEKIMAFIARGTAVHQAVFPDPERSRPLALWSKAAPTPASEVAGTKPLLPRASE